MHITDSYGVTEPPSPLKCFTCMLRWSDVDYVLGLLPDNAVFISLVNTDTTNEDRLGFFGGRNYAMTYLCDKEMDNPIYISREQA